MSGRPMIERTVPLIDMEIERSGDGRTVTAYAATFDDPYPVRDADGDYDETIARTAFNRQLGRGLSRVQVLFNHGRTVSGTPSERYSMPLGTPLEITAEPRGLLTRTRYAKTELADEVLELIRAGAITAQSFRGPVYRTNPPTRDPVTGRTRLHRVELGLADYGPATFVVNHGAEILAVRSATMIADEVAHMTVEERAELASLLNPASDGPPPAPAPDPSLEEPVLDPAAEHATNDTDLLIALQAQRRRRPPT